MTRGTSVLDLYAPAPARIRYPTERFRFLDAVREATGARDLQRLHEGATYERLRRETDQSTIWHRRYYAAFENLVKPVYLSFLAEFVSPTVGIDPSDLIVQAIPTFRAHLPGNIAVGEWHRDRDYNHDSNEVNFWLPFTDAWGTNTVWMESEEGRGDFRPYPVKYGEILLFNGADLLHGNRVNKTPFSRVSMDFRVVRRDRFRPSAKGSVNTGTRFDIGGYFVVLADALREEPGPVAEAVQSSRI